MNNWRAIIFFFYLVVSQTSCDRCKRKRDITEKFHRTGEPIAVENFIQQFESEHQKFYKEETIKRHYMEWPALDKKDLSNYCKQYLQHIIPSRKNTGTIGVKIREKLHYKKENTNIIIDIIMVQCKISYTTHKASYYITRAHEPNCVYALKSSGNLSHYIFYIVHKHCNFEDKPFINSSLQRESIDYIDRVMRSTGQPVAKDEYLLQYELQHQEMIKNTVEAGEGFQWSYAMVHPNLNLYCYQYMIECCPERNREGVKGSWNIHKLRYQKLNTDDIDVTTIHCMLPYASQKRYYHTIRAPETNCVYGARRIWHLPRHPLVIIYKQCDFQDSQNDQLTILEKNVIPNNEVKEEKFETMQLFL